MIGRWRRQPPEPSDDAKAALQQARRARIDAEHLASYADEVVSRLAATRQRNHFADAIARAIRGEVA